MKKRIAVLGSTGSIGRQTLDVARAHSDRFDVVALVAGQDEAAVRAQAEEFSVGRWGLGEERAIECAQADDVDVVLNAVVGFAGLRASMAALSAGKILALANKESLVAAGELCDRAARDGGGRIVPVDSEHAAISQALRGIPPGAVARVVLTASGGPFRTARDLSRVTPSDALDHPTWSMGPKITVDSATMMNKALEIIEAHHLFGLEYERIDVVVHPQSIVHGMVELIDGSTVLHAAPTDMRIPILSALASPDVAPAGQTPVDLAALGSLVFEPLDRERFPAVGLGFRAGGLGRTYPAALNAANEVAVRAFLDGVIGFTAIVAVVARVVDRHRPRDATSFENVLAADQDARDDAVRLLDEVASDDGGMDRSSGTLGKTP